MIAVINKPITCSVEDVLHDKFILFSFKDVFLTQKADFTERETDTQREVFHLLVRAPNGHDGQKLS